MSPLAICNTKGPLSIRQLEVCSDGASGEYRCRYGRVQTCGRCNCNTMTNCALDIRTINGSWDLRGCQCAWDRYGNISDKDCLECRRQRVTEVKLTRSALLTPVRIEVPLWPIPTGTAGPDPALTGQRFQFNSSYEYLRDRDLGEGPSDGYGIDRVNRQAWMETGQGEWILVDPSIAWDGVLLESTGWDQVDRYPLDNNQQTSWMDEKVLVGRSVQAS